MNFMSVLPTDVLVMLEHFRAPLKPGGGAAANNGRHSATMPTGPAGAEIRTILPTLSGTATNVRLGT
jgi:hypothetical protein